MVLFSHAHEQTSLGTFTGPYEDCAKCVFQNLNKGAISSACKTPAATGLMAKAKHAMRKLEGETEINCGFDKLREVVNGGSYLEGVKAKCDALCRIEEAQGGGGGPNENGVGPVTYSAVVFVGRMYARAQRAKFF
jgi:hypothetical protein